MLVTNPAYSVQARVHAMPITYTCDPPYTSTARPKSSKNAETSIDVIAVGHIIDLAGRLKSCMRAGIKAKKPLVMYSSKICDDEMAAMSVTSLQLKVAVVLFRRLRLQYHSFLWRQAEHDNYGLDCCKAARMTGFLVGRTEIASLRPVPAGVFVFCL
jgi:hypothetical protein